MRCQRGPRHCNRNESSSKPLLLEREGAVSRDLRSRNAGSQETYLSTTHIAVLRGEGTVTCGPRGKEISRKSPATRSPEEPTIPKNFEGRPNNIRRRAPSRVRMWNGFREQMVTSQRKICRWRRATPIRSYS